MSLYNKLLRDEKYKLKGLPTYLVNNSFLQSLRISEMYLKYEDVSLSHTNQVFIINDDLESSTIHTAIFHVIDVPATSRSGPMILVTSYITFMRDPEGSLIKPFILNLALSKDEVGDCKTDVLGSNITYESFGRAAEEAEKLLLQYIYNNILLINHALHRSKDVITGIEKKTIKTGNEKGKKAYSEVEFRHLSLRRYVSDGASKASRNIEWNYSWVVRGHWRYFTEDKLGVNRSGSREEIGRTWVNEYVKNEGKELDIRVKKIGVGSSL